MAKHITPREKDYSQWYLDIVKEAQLAEHSPVRGCMVIKTYWHGSLGEYAKRARSDV